MYGKVFKAVDDMFITDNVLKHLWTILFKPAKKIIVIKLSLKVGFSYQGMCLLLSML